MHRLNANAILHGELEHLWFWYHRLSEGLRNCISAYTKGSLQKQTLSMHTAVGRSVSAHLRIPETFKMLTPFDPGMLLLKNDPQEIIPDRRHKKIKGQVW